jgi:hypothetical protein
MSNVAFICGSSIVDSVPSSFMTFPPQAQTEGQKVNT